MKAEEALRQAQKMEAIGQLTGGVAHDFNNLLHGDHRQSRCVAAAAVDGPRCRRRTSALIDAAMRGATRAATLTQRLLAFSRRQPLAAEAARSSTGWCAGMSDLLRRTLGEKITIETVLAGGLMAIVASTPTSSRARS